MKAYKSLKLLVRNKILDAYIWIFHQILCSPTTENQKAIIVFAPHQDDEILGAGGLITLKKLKGIPVSVIFLTDGRNSHQAHSIIQPELLAQIRKQESLTALMTLGIEPSAIYFLDQLDGSLSELGALDKQRLIDQIIQILQMLKPHEVYVPCYQDQTSDHEATYTLVETAILKAKLEIELWQYPIWMLWQPWRINWKSLKSMNTAFYRLPIDGVLHQKCKALEIYRSQCLPLTSNTDAALSPDFLRLFLMPYEIFFKSRNREI